MSAPADCSADDADTLFCLGNPLFDMTVQCEDDALLTAYDLAPNGSIIAEARHAALFESLVARTDVSYSAGGATQNSARLARRFSGGPVVYSGCIGTDKQGDDLQAIIGRSGVKALYQSTPQHPTGTCVSIVTGHAKCRSLVARLGAADHFDVSHLDTEDIRAALARAALVYQAGFALTVSFSATKRLIAHCQATGRSYLFNLSAPFLMQVPAFLERVKYCLTHASVVFGNETEGDALAKQLGWTVPEDVTGVSARAAWIAQQILDLGVPHTRARAVIITCGAQPLVYVSTDTAPTQMPVPTIAPEALVDTNGAGDAFVGGFLGRAQVMRLFTPGALVASDALAACCRAGAYSAWVIVQQEAVPELGTLPELAIGPDTFPGAFGG